MKKTIMMIAFILAGYSSTSLSAVTKICSTDASDPHYLKVTTTFGETANDSYAQIQMCAMKTEDCSLIGQNKNYGIQEIIFEEKNDLVNDFKTVLLNDFGTKCNEFAIKDNGKIETVAKELGQALDSIQQRANRQINKMKKSPYSYRSRKAEML